MKKLLFLILFVPCVLSAQTKKDQKDVERRLNALIEYLEIQTPKDTLKNWVKWVAVGESTSAEINDRTEGWRKFLLSLYDNLGTMPGGIVNKPMLQNWAGFLSSNIMRGRIIDFETEAPTTPIDELGNIKIAGKGNETIVLLAPIGYGWEVYSDLIETYKDQYKFIGITYPGSNGLPGYSFPDQRTPASAEWLSALEGNIIKQLDNLGVDQYYVVSMATSTYTAMKLGLTQPEKVKGIININGAFAASLMSPDNPEERASIDYREKFNEAAYPTALLIDLNTSIFNNFMDFTKDASKQQSYLGHIKKEQIPAILRYLNEYSSQDLWGELDNIKAPILNLISVHDSKSVKAANKTVHRFWEEVEIDKPGLDSKTIFIPDARDAAYIDQPSLFSFYFDAFIKNPSAPINQITDNKVASTLPQPSPAAGLRQTFGGIQVELDYHKPGVNERKIFGELVPFGEVWRAGANEATRITFSNDVEVNGQQLKKGTYGLFAIPEKDNWTIVFNHVSEQWGAFNYNSRYDAARISVQPETIAFQELLSYSLKNIGNESIEVTLAWAETKVRFNIREAFELPNPPADVLAFNWIKLLEDKSGDGMNQGLTDGKTLSYHLDQNDQTLWFKFDLYGQMNPNAFAMNILIDTDADQETGMNWFGTNTAFKFEKCLTLWMRREGQTYGGTNGITDQPGIFANEWNRLKKDNLTYYLDDVNQTYTVGVSLEDLDITNGTINLIGAVGEYMTWNDDIGDAEFATIKLKE